MFLSLLNDFDSCCKKVSNYNYLYNINYDTLTRSIKLLIENYIILFTFQTLRMIMIYNF